MVNFLILLLTGIVFSIYQGRAVNSIVSDMSNPESVSHYRFGRWGIRILFAVNLLFFFVATITIFMAAAQSLIAK